MGFSPGFFIYTEEDVALINSSKVLLDDLIHREVRLQDLVKGLKEIGNRKAVSIIEKGSHFILYVPFICTRI